MAEVLASQEKRDPLDGVSCGKSDCASGLHCFDETKKKASSLVKGVCAACGVEVSVDWERVKKREIVDVDYTIDALKKRWISHLYWCEVEEIDERALNHARRKVVKAASICASLPKSAFEALWEKPRISVMVDKPPLKVTPSSTHNMPLLLAVANALNTGTVYNVVRA